MKNYNCQQIEKLAEQYLSKNGTCTTIEEGVLGFGTMVCEGEGLKTAVIKEVFVNEWASTHTVRFYNKTPKNWERKVLAIS